MFYFINSITFIITIPIETNKAKINEEIIAIGGITNIILTIFDFDNSISSDNHFADIIFIRLIITDDVSIIINVKNVSIIICFNLFYKYNQFILIISTSV